MLQEQYDDLSRLCDWKPELLNSEEALIAFEHLVYEEVGAKSSNPGCVNQSNMFVLRERLSEFKKMHKNMNLKSRCDMDAISNVLECAETLNVYLNCKVAACGSMSWRPCGLASSAEDTCNKLAMCRQKTKFLMRLGLLSIFLLKVRYLS